MTLHPGLRRFPSVFHLDALAALHLAAVPKVAQFRSIALFSLTGCLRLSSPGDGDPRGLAGFYFLSPIKSDMALPMASPTFM